jgi:hypothetical protein
MYCTTIDLIRRGVEVTIRDVVGARNMFLVRKGLATHGADAAAAEATNGKCSSRKCYLRAVAVVLSWVPDFTCYRMGFDVNGP